MEKVLFFMFGQVVLISGCMDYFGTKKPHKANENELRIVFNGDPQYFIPKSMYIVSVESTTAYTSFTLSKELDETIEQLEEDHQKISGWFSLLPEDNQTQFSNDCINTLTEKTTALKTKLHVFWIAPVINGCIRFRTIVDFHKEINGSRTYYAEKELCGLPSQPWPRSFVSVNKSKCCACDEANYRLTIEGLWSINTHKRGFPEMPWLVHFSDFIGASHSPDFIIWEEGHMASEGFRQLAEWGSVGNLESELREKKRYLRTLIKATGMWYPRVNSNTTATFVVDPLHPCVSIAAMIGPSPDWVIGASGVNLCESSCSWVEEKTLDLFPYDAGTDSGISYMSENEPTDPQEVIRRITTTYPEDPRAPFYDPTGADMKPFARLYLQRERVIRKQCAVDTPDKNHLQDETDEDNKIECAVSDYTEWSPCSDTCGKGVQFRSRTYLDQKKAKLAACKRKLYVEDECMAKELPLCPDITDEKNILLLDNSNCSVTQWSQWSDCSVSCGIGFMIRTRHFIKYSARKRCRHIQLVEKKKCVEKACKASQIQKEEISNCSLTDWSDWTPCTVTCGRGVRIRARYLLEPYDKREKCAAKLELEQRKECIPLPDCIINERNAKEICQLPVENGPCQGGYKRWYFNAELKQCFPFQYGGCRGNRNNFITFKECTKTCAAYLN